MKKKQDQLDNGFPEKLAAPARRALAGAGIHRLEQLTAFSEGQLMQLHGFGPNALKLLRAALTAIGLAFAKGKKK